MIIFFKKAPASAYRRGGRRLARRRACPVLPGGGDASRQVVRCRLFLETPRLDPSCKRAHLNPSASRAREFLPPKTASRWPAAFARLARLRRAPCRPAASALCARAATALLPARERQGPTPVSGPPCLRASAAVLLCSRRERQGSAPAAGRRPPLPRSCRSS
jgi:hypothetical protein